MPRRREDHRLRGPAGPHPRRHPPLAVPARRLGRARRNHGGRPGSRDDGGAGRHAGGLRAAAAAGPTGGGAPRADPPCRDPSGTDPPHGDPAEPHGHGALRRRRRVAGGPPVTLDPVLVEPVLVEPVSVPPALPFTTLRGADEVDVADGSSRDYVAPAGVLFAEESHVLRKRRPGGAPGGPRRPPVARADRAGHGRRPHRRPGQRRLRDDPLPGPRPGRRALARRGGWAAPPRIAAVVGYGEAHPVYPNTSEANMARNRRVVISVSR